MIWTVPNKYFIKWRKPSWQKVKTKIGYKLFEMDFQKIKYSEQEEGDLI